MLEGSPRGLFDPVLWRNNKCKITITVMINGKMKCKEKNRVSVALLMPNPPQIHSTNIPPTYGKAENKLVITVAPQKLIWPHGRR